MTFVPSSIFRVGGELEIDLFVFFLFMVNDLFVFYHRIKLTNENNGYD